MTEEEKKNETNAEEKTTSEQEQAVSPEAAAPSPQEAELMQLQQEKADLEERLLRLRADFDNFRKRSRQQLAEGRAMAIENFASSLLPVIDNLERALAACQGTETEDGLKTGVEMIRRQLLDVLAQEEIKPIDSVGHPFDPYLHEAVASEETDEMAEGTIIEEYLRGYIIGQRVLRYSKVKVAQAKKSGKDEVEDE